MRQKFKITELLRAVCLDGHSIGAITEISEDSIVESVGDAKIPGLVEVNYNGVRLALFHQDLVYRSQKILTARTTPTS